jgi:DNA-binding NarL/FixJ family response regulator
MGRPKVLLADDHRVVMDGLASLLRERCELVALADDGNQLVDAARRTQPDVIVADMSMPGLSGLDALRRLKSEGVAAKVLFLTMHRDAALAAEALRAGASGYLLKQSASEEVMSAIREALAGRVFVSPEIASDVFAALAGTPPPSARLTARQHDVLRLVVEGKTMKEVAAALKLSRRTVETHKYEMMQTLGVQTSGELIQYAFRHGLATT